MCKFIQATVAKEEAQQNTKPRLDYYIVATFVVVLICSVVVAAITSPPVAAALAAMVPIGAMGKWVQSLWKKYEYAIKSQ